MRILSRTRTAMTALRGKVTQHGRTARRGRTALRAMAVLVAVSPCALAISVPLGVLAANGIRRTIIAQLGLTATEWVVRPAPILYQVGICLAAPLADEIDEGVRAEAFAALAQNRITVET